VTTALDYIPLQLPRSYKRITRVEGSIPYPAAGGALVSNPMRIDQSGCLLSLLLTFSGTVTVPAGGAAPVYNGFSPYGLIQYVTIQTSGGVGRQINIPGYALNVAERTRESDYADGPVVPSPAAGANAAMTWSLCVPICVRDGDLYGYWSDYLGAIYTGDPEVTLQLQVTWNTFAAIATNPGAGANATVLSGNLTVTSFKLDVPTPDQDPGLLASISWSRNLIEEQNFGITAAGPFSPNPLPSAEPRVYLRIWDLVQNNGNPANGVLSLWDSTLQDYIDFMQSIPEQVLLEIQRRRYVNPLPAGTYCLDFSPGNTRQQWLAVQNVTLFKLTPTISNVALVNAAIDRISEYVVPSPLARKWVRAAQARQQAQPAGSQSPLQRAA
jgi:hypothetical protein